MLKDTQKDTMSSGSGSLRPSAGHLRDLSGDLARIAGLVGAGATRLAEVEKYRDLATWPAGLMSEEKFFETISSVVVLCALLNKEQGEQLWAEVGEEFKHALQALMQQLQLHQT